MKNDFRKHVLNLRKQQSPDFIFSNSNIIVDKLLSMNCIMESKNIMLYLDFNNEVQTSSLVKKLLSLQKLVSSPITFLDSRHIVPYQILDLDKTINIGAYGIREPNTELCSVVDTRDIDVVIVPAVAYDINCYRLGYGGGFYDKFLSNLKPNTVTIGVAFDFQIFDSVPIEPHDAQLDYVITESRVITSNHNK